MLSNRLYVLINGRKNTDFLIVSIETVCESLSGKIILGLIINRCVEKYEFLSCYVCLPSETLLNRV